MLCWRPGTFLQSAIEAKGELKAGNGNSGCVLDHSGSIVMNKFCKGQRKGNEII